MAKTEKPPASETKADTSRFAALTTLAPILLTVATLRMAFSWCYYALVDALALDIGYDGAPILFAASTSSGTASN